MVTVERACKFEGLIFGFVFCIPADGSAFQESHLRLAIAPFSAWTSNFRHIT